ncbi:MAG: hypothetical protein KIT17_14120 [Rubrivivax sp.]|nr:hypothetical protein [Rubrivivax sp.]
MTLAVNRSRFLLVPAAVLALAGAPCASVLAQAPAASAATASGPPTCSAAEYRQFDFWLGDWDVHTPDGKLAGRNVITRIAGGCALHENWAGRGGFTGQSLNAWNAREKRWQQTWLDSAGGRLDLAGAFGDGAMVLEGTTPHPKTAGATQRHRITWTPNTDSSVRQLWQTSDDDGRSWATAFDGRYVRRP